MSDYNTPIHVTQGGEQLVVASGGSIVVESGGSIDVEGNDVGSLLAIVAAIPTTDQEDSATIWNDGGVLKVSTAGT